MSTASSVSLDHTNQLRSGERPEGVTQVVAIIQTHTGNHRVILQRNEAVAALASGTGTLRSIEVTRGSIVTFSGHSTVVAAEGSKEISVMLTSDGTKCNIFYYFQGAGAPELKRVQWSSRLDQLTPPAPLLAVTDDAFDAARRTTVDDLNLFGNVDNWLKSVEQSASAGVHYSDQWSFFMFWVNDIRYADRRHTGNQITIGDSTKTRNERETRTVIESGPTLITSKTTSTPPVTESTTYSNDSTEDQQYAIAYSETTGEDSNLTVTKAASFNVGVNVTIGSFGINASGTVSRDQSSSLSKNQSQTKSVDNTILIKAGKQMTVTTTVTTTTTVNLYETLIKIRGRLNQPTINVPPLKLPPASASFDDIGTWYRLEDLPSIGANTSQKAAFELTTVTHETVVSFHEADVTPKAPQKPKQPMFLEAFKDLAIKG